MFVLGRYSITVVVLKNQSIFIVKIELHAVSIKPKFDFSFLFLFSLR